jgi:hypothetical protein
MKPVDIAQNLYVGGDAAYEMVKDKPEWRSLRVCKFGPGGHKESLGYTSMGAPRGPDYLSVVKKNRMALNAIDVADPNLIPIEMIETGLKYVDSQLRSGHKVLIACNEGHSRGPTTGLLYLRAIGEFPGMTFQHAERIFRGLYPQYSPGIGMRHFAKTNWQFFDNLLSK